MPTKTIVTMLFIALSAGFADVRAQTAAAKPGTVLLLTSLSHAVAGFQVRLARPDAQNRFATFETERSAFSGGKDLPMQIELPAGRYGIVSMQAGRMRFNGKLIERKDIFFGIGDIWRPLVVFTVRSGEVVDVGKLVFLQGGGRSSRGSGTFHTRIEATPPETLRLLAEKSPALSKARVVRLMVAPRN